MPANGNPNNCSMNTNSKTSINQATHIPVELNEADAKDLAVPKFGFAKSLQLKPVEYAALGQLIQETASDPQGATETLDALWNGFQESSESQLLPQLEQAGTLNHDHLQLIGDLLAGHRQVLGDQFLLDVDALQSSYEALQPVPDPVPLPDPGVDPDPSITVPTFDLSEPEIGLELEVVPTLDTILTWMDDNGHSGPLTDTVRTGLDDLDLLEQLGRLGQPTDRDVVGQQVTGDRPLRRADRAAPGMLGVDRLVERREVEAGRRVAAGVELARQRSLVERRAHIPLGFPEVRVRHRHIRCRRDLSRV